MTEKNSFSFLAIDLGATSGRAIVGTLKNNTLELQEINRFANPIIEVGGRLHWNILHLYSEIINSIKLVVQKGIEIESLGVDSWGVDFVCFGKDGELLRNPYSYRDTHNHGAPERFFNKIPKEDVYNKTGIQIMNFNTLFQLDTKLETESSVYSVIDKILFMPDALSYLLTGSMVTEYSIASTSQMINPYKKEFDPTLLDAINLSEDNFAPIVFSGTKIGNVTESIKQSTGIKDLSVIAVAGHDTASAVLATPAEDDSFAYLSSGTWSLMGIESDRPVINDETYNLNFTNEGGADGSVRLLKNICGMWLVEECKKEWAKEGNVQYEDIMDAAQCSKPFVSFINPDSPSFASPKSMINAIKQYCQDTNQDIPETMGDIARCIYESLAFRYRQVLHNLQKLSSKPIDKLHIIGGGSKNNILNQYTANSIGLTVVSGPSEATAMGNILMQAKAAGVINTKEEMRKVVRNSVELTTFMPHDNIEWTKHYHRYLSVFKDFN